MPALRRLAEAGERCEYGLELHDESSRWPPRSSGAPWCGVPRKTSLRSVRSHVVAGRLAVMTRAAGNQPAHAVSDDHQLLDGRRPARGGASSRSASDARWQRCAGRCCSAGRAACSRARLPASAPWAWPSRAHWRSFRHRPCTSTSSLPVGAGPIRRTARRVRRVDSSSPVAEAHLDRQRVARAVEIVAVNAVDGRNQGIARRRMPLPPAAGPRRARGLRRCRGRRAHGRAAHTAIDETRDARGSRPWRVSPRGRGCN